MDQKISSPSKTQYLTLYLPPFVQAAARKLIKEGFKVYLAGGAIRDVMLKYTPHDYDLYTDATPDQMVEVFSRVITVGAKFGTVIALQRDDQGETYEVEVTTLRSEEQYIRGRWPSKVKFETDIYKDLARRDFTINSMALNLDEQGLNYLNTKVAPSDSRPEHIKENTKTFTVIDPHDGQGDLKKKVVKAVGSPLERFSEDGLRTFKACRMASQLGFTLDSKTGEAIGQSLTIADQISRERIRDEFLDILYKSPKPSHGIELLRKTGLLKLFLPELLETVGVKQPIGHVDDVYTHTLRTIDIAPDRVKLAALFHDIGKPQKAMPDGHFYGHDILGAEIAEEVMTRLKFPKKEIQRIKILVKFHMFYYPHYQDQEDGPPQAQTRQTQTEQTHPQQAQVRPAQTQQTQKQQGKISQTKVTPKPAPAKGKHQQNPEDKPHWTDAAVRRFIRRVGEENIEDLFTLRIADANSNPASIWESKEIEALEKRIAAIRQQDMALKVTDLAIDGNDLMKLGVPQGPQMGKILNNLLEKVIDDPNLNSKEKLLEIVDKEFAKKEK